MKPCRKCGTPYPLAHYPTYPSGTPKPYCRPCIALYQKEQRAKSFARPDYMPSYTEMRHPDPAFMEANVQNLIKKYADEQAKLAHLPFKPEAWLADQILKGI